MQRPVSTLNDGTSEAPRSVEAVPAARAPAPSAGLRNWLRHSIGIDRAIAFTVLGRGWASLAGLVTVALIARFLSPAEQGYYYTFGNLVALQIIFELGFSFVILQMASHERAHITIAADGRIVGDAKSHDRLASVLQKTVRWYAAVAVLLVVSLLSAGTYFFSFHSHGTDQVSWRMPWFAAAISVTLTFLIDPILSFMEGCGFVSNVARVRLIQAIAGSSLAWSVLVTHHGLFAPAMIIIGNASVASIWLYRYRHLLLSLLCHNPGENNIHWMREVWTFQWRIAVTWLCGYFIFQLYNPVLFAFRGAVAAGQMGMSLSLAGAVSAVSVSWINTKAAPFGVMISRRDFEQLDSVFFKALWQSIMVCFAGALLVWLLIVYLNWANLPLAHRVLDPLSFGILLIGTCINVAVSGEALYLRAHKEERFLVPSVIGAILIGSSTFIFGKYSGALGMVSGALVVTLLWGLPSGTYIFLKCRRLWHAA